VSAELVGDLCIGVSADLRGQHLPSAIAHDLIRQRATGHADRVLVVRLGVVRLH
jgi:hypothetical protein